MYATGVTVGLAEGIINDAFLAVSVLITFETNLVKI